MPRQSKWGPAPFKVGDKVTRPRWDGDTVYTVTMLRKRPGHPGQWQLKVYDPGRAGGHYNGGKWDAWDFCTYYQLKTEDV